MRTMLHLLVINLVVWYVIVRIERWRVRQHLEEARRRATCPECRHLIVPGTLHAVDCSRAKGVK